MGQSQGGPDALGVVEIVAPRAQFFFLSGTQAERLDLGQRVARELEFGQAAHVAFARLAQRRFEPARAGVCGGHERTRLERARAGEAIEHVELIGRRKQALLFVLSDRIDQQLAEGAHLRHARRAAVDAGGGFSAGLQFPGKRG